MVDEKRIYFDNAATTRVDPRVIQKMLPLYETCYGNASSMHQFGTQAKEVMEHSRRIIAGSLNAGNQYRIIFTSGGTEANNLALTGIAFANKKKGKHIIISSVEHDCIYNTAKWLSSQGFEITVIPVDENGLIKITQLEAAIRPDTILVSVMHVNNEIGTIQPIYQIGAICRAKNTYFHTDACQSYGKIQLDAGDGCLDLITINAHKIYGPKGVGALLVRNDIPIEAILHGGGQEGGIRSSTENIPGIAGFAEAAQLCMAELEQEETRLTILRDRLEEGILDSIPQAYINGSGTNRICSNINVAFHGYEGEGIRLLFALDDMGIAVSAGSACSSNASGNPPSHVLTAIGRNPIEARGAMRISLGRFNQQEEIEEFLKILPEVFSRLHSIHTL